MSFDDVPLLVSTEWLTEKLTAQDNIVLLDTLWVPLENSYEKYKTLKHIPGARHFDIKKGVVSTGQIPRNFPEPETFEDYVQSLTINNDSHVILYDRDDANDLMSFTLTSARIWWLFRMMGHQKVSVLDGGFVKWQKEGHDVTEDDPAPATRGNFKHGFSPKGSVTYDRLISTLDEGSHQIIDARIDVNFLGTEKEPCLFTELSQKDAKVPVVAAEKMLSGHMPGARNIPFPSFFSKETNCLQAPQTLRKMFADAGVDLGKPLITTCYIGHSACTVALAAAVCGKTDTTVYYGSWVEFGQRAPAEMCIQNGS